MCFSRFTYVFFSIHICVSLDWHMCFLGFTYVFSKKWYNFRWKVVYQRAGGTQSLAHNLHVDLSALLFS